jgi:hypothetical protein
LSLKTTDSELPVATVVRDYEYQQLPQETRAASIWWKSSKLTQDEQARIFQRLKTTKCAMRSVANNDLKHNVNIIVVVVLLLLLHGFAGQAFHCSFPIFDMALTYGHFSTFIFINGTVMKRCYEDLLDAGQ